MEYVWQFIWFICDEICIGVQKAYDRKLDWVFHSTIWSFKYKPNWNSVRDTFKRKLSVRSYIILNLKESKNIFLWSIIQNQAKQYWAGLDETIVNVLMKVLIWKKTLVNLLMNLLTWWNLSEPFDEPLDLKKP